MLKENLEWIINGVIGERPTGEGLIKYRDPKLNYLAKLYLVLFRDTANLSIEFFN